MKIQNKRDIRIGERKQNNQGDWMEIVEYRNQGDLDVRFDLGGAIIRNRKYDNFRTGGIKNPNHYLTHIGERYQSKNGYWFEVVDYVDKKKPVLKFDDFDDLVIRNNYNNITKAIHPQEKAIIRAKRLEEKERQKAERKKQKRKSSLIGRSVINNQGLNMTIVHKDGNYVDVQFEDGTIVKHKHIKGFKKRCICNPNYSNSKTLSRNEFSFYYYLQDYGFRHYEQGELKEYGVGQYSVDLFNPELMVAIEYDGRFHRREKDQRKNKKFTDHGITVLRVREPEADELDDGLSVNFSIANANNFDPALTTVINEVIAYLNANYDVNIDVDVDVVRDRDDILSRYLDETDYRLRNKRIGERTQNRQGLWVEIVDYRSADDLDIKFDIDGSIKKHRTYKQFKEGELPHDKYTTQYFQREERLGETNTNISGLSMKIVEYRSAVDIDVMFENGLIAEHVDYYHFQHGKIKDPVEKLDRTGETTTNRLGQQMKIIEWRGNQDIDVEMEDGTIYRHKEYRQFKKGTVFHGPIDPKSRVGQRFKTTRGLWVEIIEYRSSSDVDVRFDIDGTVLKHRTYNSIKIGMLRHPNRADLIGEQSTDRFGRVMELIKYRTAVDIDVKFIDDGSIVKHREYYNFKQGAIRHP